MSQIFFILFCFLFTSIYSQQTLKTEFGELYKFNSNNTSFPHSNRSSGHKYKGEHYSEIEHYNDSSVLFFVPNYFTPKDSIDLVFYFHGWWNNIDSSITKFNLLKQFYKSGINAVLVLPETAKNVPDSFGGKLEEKNIFQNLVSEILFQIENIFSKEMKLRTLTLAGHSGAYRVIAYILSNGGIANQVKNVLLFDALYGEIEKYKNWIDNYKGKFVNIYTPNGGTKVNSESLISYFDKRKYSYKIFKDKFASNDLKESKIIFIKSELGHSEVLYTNNQFQKFLEATY